MALPKDGQFFMSTVTARALPSLKKFSYNDKHDTLTIYYYTMPPVSPPPSPCQNNPPNTPAILYAPHTHILSNYYQTRQKVSLVFVNKFKI